MYDDVTEVRPGLYVNSRNKVVHPILKDISQPFSFGNINWKNLCTGGSYLNNLIILALLFTAWSYAHDTDECRNLMANHCAYCGTPQCNDYVNTGALPDIPTVNITESTSDTVFSFGDLGGAA